MTLLAIDNFGGMVPKFPAHLLPDGSAQYCINCDLAHGDLRGLVDSKLAYSHSAGIGSLYVQGLYAAPQYIVTGSIGVLFVEGPQPSDKSPRVYYLSPGGEQVLRVFVKSEVTAPVSVVTGVKAGVPAPTALPTVTLSDKTSWPLGATKLKVTWWYEYLGAKYQTTGPVDVTTVGRTFSIAAPAAKTAADESKKIAGTPTESVLVVQVDGVNATGTTVFSMTSENSAYATTALEVPGGVTATLDATGAGKLLFRTFESRAYLFTHVNNLGEESAPSEAVAVDIDAMHKVMIALTAPTTFANYRPLAKYRVYRTSTSSTGVAKFQFLTDRSSVAAFEDTWESAALGEVLPSDYYSLPSTGCTALSYAGSGMLAMARGNTVYFSEPFLAHAWNPLNYVTLPYNVVSMFDSPSGLVVLTEGNPFLISGVTPDAMSSYRLPAIQGCLSPQGSTDLGDAVAFVSHDGLTITSGSEANLDLSQKFWARDNWRTSWASSSLRLAYHDGHIFGSYPTGVSGATEGFALRLDDAAGTLTHTNLFMDGVAYTPYMDAMFYTRGNQVYKVSAADNQARAKFIWHSKIYVLPKPENFGVMQIALDGASPSVQIEVFADRTLNTSGGKPVDKAVCTVTANGVGYHTFRLPSGFMAKYWSFQFTDLSPGRTSIVKQFQIATAGVELGNR